MEFSSETLSQTHSFNDILNHPLTSSPSLPIVNLLLDNTQQLSDFSCKCL